MRSLSIVGVLPTVDAGRRAPSLKKQPGVPAQKLSYVLLWTGPAVKTYFSHLKKALLKKFNILRTFSPLYPAVRQPFPLALHFLFIKCLIS